MTITLMLLALGCHYVVKHSEKGKHLSIYIPQTSAAGQGLGTEKGCWTRAGVWGSPCLGRRWRPLLPLTGHQSETTHRAAGTEG